MKIIALSLLVACNNLGDETSDSPAPASSGSSYDWGSGGSSGSEEESEDEPADTAADDTATTGGSDSGDDTETDPVVETIDAYVVIFPKAEWEASLDLDGSPVVEMYETANATTGDWTDYGSTTVSADSSDEGIVMDAEIFTPGDTLVTGAYWWDGYSTVYFAAAGNTVNSEEDDWDNDGDVEKVVIVIYDNDTYDVYEIDSTGVDTSQAYYVDSGSGHDVYVQTSLNVSGEYAL